MSNNTYIVESGEPTFRLAYAQQRKELKIEDLPAKLRDALRTTLHRVKQLEQDCRIHYRGNAIMQYKLSRVQLMAARRHLMNLLKMAHGEPVEEEVSPWSFELGLSKIPPKLQREWRQAAMQLQEIAAAYIKEGNGFDVGQNFSRAAADIPIELDTTAYAKPGHVIGYIAPDPNSKLGFLRGPGKIRVHVRKDAIIEKANTEIAQAKPFAHIVDKAGNHKANIYFDSRSNSYYTPLVAKTRAGRATRGFRGERSPLTLLNSIKRHCKQHGIPEGAADWRLTKANQVETAAKSDEYGKANDYAGWDLPGLANDVEVMIKDAPHWTKQELADQLKAVKAYKPKNREQENAYERLNNALSRLANFGLHGKRKYQGGHFGSLQRFSLQTIEKSAQTITQLPHTIFPNKAAAEKVLHKMQEHDKGKGKLTGDTYRDQEGWQYKISANPQSDKCVIKVFDPEHEFMGLL